MYSLKDRDEFVEEFTRVFDERVETYCQDVKLEDFMKRCDPDLVRDGIKKIYSNAVIAVPTGIVLPSISIREVCNGNDTDGITVVVMTLYGENYRYHLAVTTPKAKDRVCEFLKDCFVDMIVDYLINQNLLAVNYVVSSAAREAELEYDVSVVSPASAKGTGKVSSISDQDVVFVADPERVFNLNDYTVFQEPDNNTLMDEETVARAFKGLVIEMSACQTPEQLVAAKGTSLLEYICGFGIGNPMKQIKLVTNKNIRGSKRVKKDSLFYYNENDVFALIEKKDGELKVVLSPFDIKTQRKVDLDVLKAVDELLAEE